MSSKSMKGNQHGKKHGMYGTQVYRAWSNMKARCDNPKVSNYKNYGGRGISYIPEWADFINFYTVLGEPPTIQHTLERIDNEVGYNKENCKWATRKEQANNTRQTVLVEIGGEVKCFHDWCKEYGIPPANAYYRLKKGVDIKEALTNPYCPTIYTPINNNPDKAKGVWYNPAKRKYRAQVSVKGGGKKHLGWFSTCEEAHQAYINSKEQE